MLRNFLMHGSNLLLILALIIIGGCAVTGQIALYPLWILCGMALFYMSEYGWHRFVFHAPPSRWGWLRFLQHRLHYDHHIDPARLDLLFLPVWFVLPNLTITWLAAWAVLGDWQLAIGIVADIRLDIRLAAL